MEHMVKRIELEKRGRKPEDVTELNLDNCRSTQIHGLTSEFTNLKSLSLINVGLTTLKGFPDLPNLRKLELSDNRLSSGFNALQGCKNIVSLSLSGNKIKDIESIEPLSLLPNLKYLDLFNCEVMTMDDYRAKVFELLPNLEYLDGLDSNGEEAEEDDEEAEDEDDLDGGANGEDVDVDEDEDDDEDDEESEDPGLSYLQKSGLENESEGEDFEPGDKDDEDDASDDEEDEDVEENDANQSAEIVEGSRGVKRKRGNEEEEEEK